MANTTKKTQTIKEKPATKVAAKTPVKAATKTVKKIASKTPVKVETKPVKEVIAKAPVKAETKPVKKIAAKTPVKVAVEPVKKSNFLTNLLQNLNFIKYNFLDVILLFKNFIHWNISKLIIFIWSVVLGFIAIIPFIIIIFIYSAITNVDIINLIAGKLGGNLMYDLIGFFILFITVAIFFIFYFYSNILLINVNNSYIEGKKLGYKLNEYFNIKKIIKFFNLSLINISILFIPILLFFVLMVILFIFSGNLEKVNLIVSSGMFNYFSVLSLLSFLISIILFVYLFYRIIFSYLIFSDINYYDEKKTALSYLKESFNKTKKIKNFFKFITIFIIFIILTSPINYFGKVLEKNDKDLNTYNLFLGLPEEKKADITGENLYYIESLKLNYEGINSDEITKMIKLNNIYIILFTILDFMFLYGLFVMIASSFYRRELI